MQKQNNETPNKVELFNNEPKICVRFGRDEVYRWANQTHGRMDTTSLKYLRDFMVRNNFQYYIFKEKNDRSVEDMVLE